MSLLIALSVLKEDISERVLILVQLQYLCTCKLRTAAWDDPKMIKKPVKQSERYEWHVVSSEPGKSMHRSRIDVSLSRCDLNTVGLGKPRKVTKTIYQQMLT